MNSEPLQWVILLVLMGLSGFALDPEPLGRVSLNVEPGWPTTPPQPANVDLEAEAPW